MLINIVNTIHKNKISALLTNAVKKGRQTRNHEERRGASLRGKFQISKGPIRMSASVEKARENNLAVSTGSS